MLATSQTQNVNVPMSGNMLGESSTSRRVRTSRVNVSRLANGGKRFELPYRQLGALRPFAWGAFGIGIFICLFMIGWMAGPVWVGVAGIMKGQWAAGLFALVFAAFGFYGLRASFYVLAASIGVLRDRTRSLVDVDDGKLIACDEFWWLSWRRQCQIDQIEQLEVSACQSDKITHAGFREIGNALLARRTGDVETSRPFVVALGYQHDVLMELAESLRGEMQLQTATKETLTPFVDVKRKTAINVEILQTVSSDDEPANDPTIPVEQPEGSTACLTRHDYGIQIDLPPPGTSRPVLVFGVLWLTVVAIMFAQSMNLEIEQPWVLPIVLSVAAVIGIAVILSAINSGRRKTSIVTAGSRLLIVSESLFGRRRREWSAEQLLRICRGVAVEPDDDGPQKPMFELQVFECTGKKTGLLREHTSDDLSWVAFELTSALNLGSSATIPIADVLRNAAGQIVVGPDSLLTISRSAAAGGTTTIETRGRGMDGFWGLLVFGLVVLVFGIGLSTITFWDESMRKMQGMDVIGAFIMTSAGLGLLAGGIALTLLAWELASRTFMFEFSGNTLHVERRGRFGIKSMSWNRHELQDVAIVDSGTEIGGRNLQQLRIRGDERQFDAMLDHSHVDLSSVVRAINEAMSLS